MNPDSRRIRWGEFVIPLIAAAYGVYALLEQYYSGARTSSLTYTAMLALPIIVCGFFALRGGLGAKAKTREAGQQSPLVAPLQNLKLMIGFFIGLVLVAALIDTLGYIVCFFVFLVAGFRALGIRSKLGILSVSAGVILFVYLVFGLWLGLELPMGFWSRLIY